MAEATTPHSPAGPDPSRSVLLSLPGAVEATGFDGGVAAHYGGPIREQRSLVRAAGLVDRSNRGLVTVRGPDRLPWLHSMLSQHVAGLAPGESTEALLLDAQGHVEFHVGVFDDGTTTWLDTEPGSAAPLSAFLDRMRFLMRVEVVDVSEAWAQLVVAGPRSEQVLAEAGPDSGTASDADSGSAASSAPSEPPAEAGAAPQRIVRRRRWPANAFDVWVPRADLEAQARVLVQAGAAPAGLEAWEALRVGAAEPRQGFETDDRSVPHELSWVATAVHLDKGCYPGQETVARIHAMGRAPRRQVLLHLDGTSEELPAHGARVRWDKRPVGFVGTSARHHEQGSVCLAVVKRAVPGEASLVVELPDGGTAVAAIDPDSELAPLAGAGAGRRAQQGLRGTGHGTAAGSLPRS